MPDSAVLARRDGVELVRTGRWQISTGQWTAARADLAAAVAALSCPAIQKPIVKIGHTDKRFTPGDGEPAIGWFENLRITDGGHTLIADQVAPSWLSDVQAAAWPNRSVEGTYNKRCGLGHSHPFVLTAVSLLGVTPPGVSTLAPLNNLADVKTLFGLAAPSGHPGPAEVRIAASIPHAQPDEVAAAGDSGLRNYWVRGEGAIKIRWGTAGDFDRCVRNLREHVRDPEGLCNEYHQEALGAPPGKGHVHASEEDTSMPNPDPSLTERIHAAWNASNPPQQQWIVEAAPDEVIVMDNTDRSLHRISVSVDGDSIAFGEPQRVRSAYVPDSEPVAASRMVFASAAESRPDVAAADSPAEPVAPAVEPDTAPEVTAGEPSVADPAEVTPTEPAPTEPTPEPPAAEPEPAPSTEPKGVDPVSTLSTDVRSRLGLTDDADDAAVLAALDSIRSKADQQPTPEQVSASAAARDEMKTEIERLSGELARINASAAAGEKAALFNGAVQAGKIKPAERESWEARYDRAPEVIVEILASIAPNTAVPVAAAGYTGDPDTVTDTIDVEYERLFGAEKAGA